MYDMFRPQGATRLQRPFNLGKVFYVDNGISGNSNNNEGTDPNRPLQTLQAGIDKCTDDQGDYVIVLDCYNSDSEPILLNSSASHVIGMHMPTPAGWTVLDGGGADLFRISANYVELAGFSMISASADAIHFYSNIGYAWLHHLNFATSAASVVNAIEFDSAYGTHSLIEDCNFGRGVVNITGTAIIGQGVSLTIRNNTFLGCATRAIDITTGLNGGGRIIHNFFAVLRANAEAKGWAIRMGSSSEGWLIAENMAGETGEGTGNNPFLDLSTGTANTNKNAWINNYEDNAISAPDVTA